MKRSMTFLMMLATGLILTGVPAVAAPPGLGLGVHGGYGESSDADGGSVLAGAHVVLNVTPWLGAVGMIDYKTDEDFRFEGSQNFTIRSYPLSVMGRVYIPLKSFSPYAAAGVQYRLIQYGGDLFDNVDLDDSDSAFGWILGAGAEINPNDNVELFGELRYELSDPDRDIDNAVSSAKSLEYDQWSLRAGITFFVN